MCGFVGCLALEGVDDRNPGWVADATQLIAHRGPDSQGAYSDGDISLGARRLAVLDPGPSGDQPMLSADGRYCIVFNGELYNHVELSADLAADGIHLRSRCDTEVLLELFARRGAEVVDALRGMYAFAIWDIRRRELFAARDRFGIKPFFYRRDVGSLRFSSEKKALVDHPHGELSQDALRRYLAMQYVPGPETLSPLVRVLPPAHTLRAGPHTVPEVIPYWKPSLQRARRADPAAARTILEALRNSVSVHLRSDVPVGAFLSGGIDSALVCALAAEQVVKLQTFTVGFDVPGYSEIDLAGETAAGLGVSWESHLISMEEFVEHLPRVLWHLDDPFGDAAAVPLWFLARQARQKVTCVLSGEGADELFGGYHVYRQHGLLRSFDRLPREWRKGLQPVLRRLPFGGRIGELAVLAGREPARRYIGPDEVYFGDDVELVSRGGKGTAHDLTEPIYREGKRQGLDDVARMQLLDVQHWLPDDILTKADRMTMAHGLELRVPFLDGEVMMAASRLARGDKLQRGTTKWILRQAASGLLPQSVVNRPKLGFPVPIRHWLRGEMFGFAYEVLRDAEVGEYVRREVALQLLERYRAGDHDDWRQVWVLICFGLWHQLYVENKYDHTDLRRSV